MKASKEERVAEVLIKGWQVALGILLVAMITAAIVYSVSTLGYGWTVAWEAVVIGFILWLSKPIR